MTRGVEVVDLGAGGTVICDACNKNYTTSDEPGGVLIGRTGIGPCCAEAQMQRARVAAYWSPGEWTMTICPNGMSFRAWLLSL